MKAFVASQCSTDINVTHGSVGIYLYCRRDLFCKYSVRLPRKPKTRGKTGDRWHAPQFSKSFFPTPSRTHPKISPVDFRISMAKCARLPRHRKTIPNPNHQQLHDLTPKVFHRQLYFQLVTYNLDHKN